MNGVTSVKQAVNWPSRFWPIVITIVGLLAMLGGSAGSITFGILLLVAAVIWWTQQKTEWLVVLSSSSGETRALASQDQGFIQGVIEALNQSIIHRG